MNHKVYVTKDDITPRYFKQITIMDIQTNITILWTLALTVLLETLAAGLHLSAYETASFSINPSSEFTHFASHSETGTVYLGANDALYQLDNNFVKQKMNNTKVECGESVQICPNYNKILLVDYTHDKLITCGSEDQGMCQTRNLSDINHVFHARSWPVATSGKSSTEAIIAPGHEGDDVLYVSAAYDKTRINDVALLSRRRLDTIQDDLSFRLAFASGQIEFVGDDFTITYAGAFHWEGFTYFVTSQAKDSNVEESETYVSKINRVCHSTKKLSDSYAEILIECRSESITYNLSQAAFVGPAGASLAVSLNLDAGDNVLYGVFAQNEGAPNVSSAIPSNHSALCVFKLQDIEEAFIDAIYGCLRDGNDFKTGYIQGSVCPGYGKVRKKLFSPHRINKC